jgi:glutamate-ammonia-ligase adenylyltransferase
VVATNAPHFPAIIAALVRVHVLKPRDETALRADVLSMRERIAKQFPTSNPWALKHVRGGMVDLDFIAQYIVLRYAATYPGIWHRAARQVFEAALLERVIDDSIAVPLIAAKKFLSDLMSLLRLSAPGGVITDAAPSGLISLLTQGMRADDLAALKAQVIHHETEVNRVMASMAAAAF